LTENKTNKLTVDCITYSVAIHNFPEMKM